MDKYTYESITTESTTRMLVLSNGAYKDQLTGHLEIAKLDNCPPWEALSYAWGETNTYSSIKIGDRFIKISNNLDDALRSLRYEDDEDDEAPHSGRRLWVDQICINQENTHERSEQVRMMYRIYEKAGKVLVYLRLDPDGIAKKAFFTLRLIASLDDDQLDLIRDNPSGARTLDPLFRHLKILFDRPWVCLWLSLAIFVIKF